MGVVRKWYVLHNIRVRASGELCFTKEVPTMAKRVIALFLCLSMLFSYSAPVLANDNTELPTTFVAEDEGDDTTVSGEEVEKEAEPGDTVGAVSSESDSTLNVTDSEPGSEGGDVTPSVSEPGNEGGDVTPSVPEPGNEGGETEPTAPELGNTNDAAAPAAPAADNGEEEGLAPSDATTFEAPGEATSETFLQAAERYYGDEGTAPVGVLNLAWENAGIQDVKAGAQINLTLEWTLMEAATYTYTYGPQSLFDSYDNTKVELILPEGVSIVQGIDGTLKDVDRIENDGQRWTLYLKPSLPANNSQNAAITVPLNIGENGERAIGEVLDFSPNAIQAKLDTSFTIMDRTDAANPVPTEVTYKKEIAGQGDLGQKTITTDDSWGIKKTVEDEDWQPNDDKTQVTVTFQLEVGLLDSKGVVVSNPNTYGRTGRVPFAADSVTLTETPSVSNREGEPIQPTSITVIPQFGEQTPISVPENGVITLPVDTCAGKKLGDVVADDAPYYSKYQVEVVYPYADFIAQYYEKNQEKLTVHNTATFSYTLQGGTPQQISGEASVDVGEVTQPAAINIRKFIVNDGGYKLYSAANFSGDAVSGAAQFTIYQENGSTLAPVYLKDGDTYTPYTGPVSIDPQGNDEYSSTTGNFTVYVDPGVYVIKETAQPANTEKITVGDNNANDKTVNVAAAGTQNADFYDQEQLGKITVTKYGLQGGTESPLQEAVFGLYEGETAEGEPLRQVTSNANGEAIFDRLAYGTYTVKEISAPDDYIRDQKTYTFIIGETKPEETQKVVNSYNKGYVTLKKLMFNGAKDYVPVTDPYTAEFNGAFTLQKKVGENWETVQSSISLTTDGTWTAELPVYEADGVTAVTYRFLETLPKGWHDPNVPAATEMTSDEFTLVDALGQGSENAHKVEMKNDRNGTITLTKKFLQKATGAGFTAVTGKESTFTLYRIAGSDGVAKQVGEPQTFTGSCRFTDLARTDEQDQAYQYYLVETQVEGYLPDTTGTQPITIPDQDGTGTMTVQAWGPISFVGEGSQVVSMNQALTVSNYAQTLPAIVKKVDSVSKSFVAGASFTVYVYDKNQPDHLGEEVISSQQITGASGQTIRLAPGKQYIVVETAPAGYTDVTEESERIIDLSGIQTVGANTDYTVRTVTLKNRPDPKLQVNKLLQSYNGQKTLANVQFEVYTKNSQGDFVRAQDYVGADLTVTSGQAKQMPAGKYWLKEIIPAGNSNQILDPAEYPELYQEKGEMKDGAFYFGPFTLKEVTDEATRVQKYDVTNYSQLGAVQVVKKAKGTDGTLSNLKDAKIGIFDPANPDTPLQTVTSGSNGVVQFAGLPIYGEDQKKINYIIKEIQAPDGYTLSDTVLTVNLEAGKTVKTDSEGEELQIINWPEMSFQVEKRFYNIWEHEFTNREFLMPGAQIALYEKQANGNYTFLQLATTDDVGAVNFTGLAQKTEYVAVEYDIPDTEEYRYLEPSERDKSYLVEAAEDGQPPQTLTQEELQRYFYVTKNAVSEDENPVLMADAKLVNVEHWAQLHIKKFIKDYQDGNKEKVVNNAAFDLYMEVLADGTPPNAELSFNEEKVKDGTYTLIGSYTTGTLYNEKGERMDGWFGTNILKCSDTVVYWLVERTGGTGAKIDPEHQITLIKRAGTKYTNGSQSLEKTEGTDGNPGTTVPSEQVFTYQDDQVKKEDTENIPIYGGGSSMFSTIRLVKWAGELDEEGNPLDDYNPLGNASFDIYLVHSDGTLAKKLDTITTGLDNDLSPAGGATGEDDNALSSWASSKAYEFNLIESYAKEAGDNGNQDIVWTDEDGNGYARVMLVESNTPAGYRSVEPLKLLMFFNYEDGQYTETFNDVYYIKDAAKKVPLSEKQGDQWALYPTKEAANGSYKLIEKVAKDAQQYRIVDWPVDNFAVTVNKYGYTVNEQNINMDGDALNEYYISNPGREPLKVTMKLQRWSNNQWVDYAYPNSNKASDADPATFTTENGTFSFPKGLSMGRYRILEVEGDPDYDNIYDGTVVSEDSYYNARAYYFQVINKNLELDLYNPEKLSLTLYKTDTADRPLSEAKFQLTLDDGTALEATTNAQGTATVTGIGSGVYTLTETPPEGYSADYLDAYLRETYQAGHTYGNYKLADFADEGIFLGFETKLENGEVIVTGDVTLQEYGISGLSLGIKDPAMCSLTLRKQDKDSKGGVPGAQFTLSYMPFQNWSGEETWDSEEALLAETEWENITENYTTGADGTVRIDDLQPGIYRIVESKAPAGYDLTAEPQYVVLTGGMSKTIKLEGDEIQKNPASALVFEDAAQVSLTVTKKVNTGSLTVSGNHTFTFTLYDSDKKTVVGTKTVTVANGATNGATFTVPAFTGLSQGKTYYLTERETPVASREDFALTGMTGEGGLVVTEEDGYYAFTVPNSNADLSITANNTYLYAEVTILKVDGSDGHALDGASFDAFRGMKQDTDGSWTYNTAPTGTWSAKGNGEHTVRLPLTDVKGNTFKIQERQAPAGYVTGDLYLELAVEPGKQYRHGAFDKSTMGTEDRNKNDTAMLQAMIFPNYLGSVIEITKYNNMKESNTTTVLENISFILYRREANGWVYLTTKATDAQGKVSFTVASNKTYAVAEVVPTGYAALQGLYQNSDGSKMNTENAVIDGKDVTLHLIDNKQALHVQTTYPYNAYNIPYVDLEIRKQNALAPNGDNQPTAVASVYEVPDNISASLTQEEVARYMTEDRLVRGDIRLDTAGVSGTEKYNFGKITGTIQSGKTYLIVETKASVTQVRDNNQVVWYKVLKVQPGTTAPQVVTLKNVAASASHTLRKATSTLNNESLLTSAATLTYTLTPQVNNSYPLDSYTLKDTGLVAYSETTKLDFDTYLKEKYSITSVKVGKATHTTEHYSDVAGQSVSATVFFYGFDNNLIEEKTVDVGTSAQTVTLNSDKKAARVEISYQSPLFQQNTSYALGQDFEPGEVQITVVLDKQEGGAQVVPITKVTNYAEAVMAYSPWDTQGHKLASTSVTQNAQVTNFFDEQKMAKVSISKDCEKTAVDLNGGVADYIVTITNLADAEAPLQNPFLVDLLPQGTVLNGTVEEAVTFAETPPEGVAFENRTSETQSGETGVFIFLQGSVPAGKSVKIKISVKATNDVASYGAMINNYVIMGSRTQGVQSESNPLASSWKTADGAMPSNLDGALTSLSGTARLEALRTMLANRNFQNYGYISDVKGISWTTASQAVIVKRGCGDRSATTGFTSDRLSTVNNNGWMKYQLIFSNLSTNYKYTGVTILDVLPYVGDKTGSGNDRESQWGMLFGQFDSVQRVDEKGNYTPVDQSAYQVLYYVQNIDDSNVEAVYAQVKTLSYGMASLPEGWVNTLPTDKSQVKAVAVVFQKAESAALDVKESYVVEYTMNVGDLSSDELAARSWNNTVNSCTVDFWRYSGSDIANATQIGAPLGSNSVGATILPEPVKVGGHIWIDKNADGIWDANTESVSALQSNNMVQKLLSKVEVQLATYTGGETRYKVYRKDSDWQQQATFTFDKLDPASPLGNTPQDGDALYDLQEEDPLSRLIPTMFKGSAPSTYRLIAVLAENAGVLAEPTSLGSTTGRSRVPETLKEGGVNAAEAADNNFAKASTSQRAAISERFYLHATDPDIVYDNTKDLGLVLYRNVTLHKVAADNHDIPVKGATFTLYGPFDTQAEANAADADELKRKTIGTYTSDENGDVALGNLNWFQYYLIEETSSGDGFLLDGAEAASTDGVIDDYTGNAITGKPVWVLTVPVDSITNPEQNITVTNYREGTFTLEAQKNLTGSQTLQAEQFTFRLGNEKYQLIEEKTNDADGKVTFSPLTVTTPGLYTYYIWEDIPKGGTEGQRVNGWLYDYTIYKVEVNVTETITGLEVDETYYVQNDKGQWVKTSGAVFTNDYTPSPAQYAPAVEKTIHTGNEPVTAVEDTFTFAIKRTDNGAADAVTMPENTELSINGAGHGSFDNITFHQAGTYTFTITEKPDKKLEDFGYTFDPVQWQLTVQAADVNGTITLTDIRYTPDDSKPESTTVALFANTYDPKETTFVPCVTKQVTGDGAPADSTFRFALELVEEDPENGSILAEEPGASIVGGGTIQLPAITFRAKGTYTFAITEQNDGLQGFTYDDTRWLLTVEVTDDGNGGLKATGVYKANLVTVKEDAAYFVNTYHPEEPSEPGENPPTTEQKTPSGGENPPVVSGNTFTLPWLPQTSDDFQPLLWVALALVSAGGILFLLYRKRKNNRK